MLFSIQLSESLLCKFAFLCTQSNNFSFFLELESYFDSFFLRFTGIFLSCNEFNLKILSTVGIIGLLTGFMLNYRIKDFNIPLNQTRVSTKHLVTCYEP